MIFVVEFNQNYDGYKNYLVVGDSIKDCIDICMEVCDEYNDKNSYFIENLYSKLLSVNRVQILSEYKGKIEDISDKCIITKVSKEGNKYGFKKF